ncbi:pre-rRNA-processing protein ESF1 [Aspergillus alliaceus]|uniref:pre-rRNA-processing protein ESF1 n=1 Tax=Petromyces alliaceus TaxID=209559 RepID=UPI0012A66071|nr:PRK-domain-containing protein [Aspergillus alliaceus]KAB8230629.1 PRK-domain-containing protein [Aspergillus alliaceus]
MESISPVFSSGTEQRYSPPWEDLSIIGIAGSSGSGKTSVAMEIVKQLNLPWVVILVMDSFYKSLTPEQHSKAHQNQFDFDCPDALDFDALVQTLKDLKQGKKADIPIYSFAHHQRQPQTTTLYSPHVIILEVIRDVRERGRDVEGIIKQWFTYVKPSYTRYVEPQRSISDMVVKHIQRKLDEKSAKHRAELDQLRQIASELQLSRNVMVMPSTPQFVGMNTILQNPKTEQVDFVFYFDRLASLLIEKALDCTSYVPARVETPHKTTYEGLNPEGIISAVAILRGGSCLETALKRTIPDCITGRVLIQTNAQNEEPELHYLKLPGRIEEHTTVMLLDPQMSTGGAALMAVRVLIDHGVEEHKIIFVTSDPRFANIQSDPRYRLPSKRQTHVKLDKRFAHMLHDKDFSRNALVDRYGRKLARDDTKKQLERFYQLEGDEEDEDDMSVADDDEVLKELKKADMDSGAYDPARDGGFSSSSSEEESSDEEDEDDEFGAGEELEFPDKQQTGVPTGDVTDRIAVVNLDWDNIRAEDLMAVFSSFAPAGGRVLKVSVYPSEFGKERMEREETEGPPREIFAAKQDDDFEGFDDDEDVDSDEEEEKIKESMLKEDKGEEFNSTELRKYQLERLRYFYAILTFSSKSVAKHVYDLVDGAEYLSSANFFDLRFVPDDTDFSDDKPRDECKRIPDGYQPNEFVTDALQHSKVKLTWDMEDKSRKEAQARAFRGSRKEIDENDLKAYLASDSSSEDEDEDGGVEVVDTTGEDGGSSRKISKKEDERQRMRALLGLSTEPTPSSKSDKPVGEMEVTFTSGLAGGSNRDSIFENEPEKDETTIEKYIRKERERRKRRKERLKAPKKDDDERDDAVDKGEAEGEKPQEEDLGFNDPFFDDPSGKESAAGRRKEEKRKKRAERAAEEAAAAAKRAELELLMMDDENKNIKHFDMNEIEKAEKQARKKGKGKGKGKQTPALVDDFQMDVSDPRFARLFESHEFAIDPTNPRFKATSGMKQLLEEGRKRRRNRDDRAEEEEVGRSDQKKQKKSEGGSEDLKKLVDKVKRKTQKS